MTRWHTTGTTGRAVGLTDQRIKQLCDAGLLQHIKDQAGRRLIPEDAVRRLGEERRRLSRKRRRSRPAQAKPSRGASVIALRPELVPSGTP
jgi:hypothetical protein